ncbi:MAG: EAL domain-containing protein [Myxococcota bacterium]
MPVHFAQAALLFAGAAITAFLLVALAREARKAPFAPLIISAADRYDSLILLLASIFIWQFTQALEFAIPSQVILLHRIGFIGIVSLPPAAFLLAQRVAGVRIPAPGYVALIPALTLAINFSGSYAGFFWDGSLDAGESYSLTAYRGPWFWVHTAHSYVCLAGCFALFARHYWRHPLRRREGLTLSFALLLPVLANIIELSVKGLEHLVITPIALGGTAMMLSWATLRDSTRDLLPRARQQIVAAMRDAVFVLDSDRRMLFANPTGHDLLGTADTNPTALTAFPSVVQFLDRGETEGDIEIDEHDRERHFHAVRSVLDEGEEIEVLALRDVTHQRAAQEQIQQLAFFDTLTGLPNRRLFQRRLAAAVEHAESADAHLAVLVIDIDRFKQVNDTLGHIAGDRMLQKISEHLLEALRASDEVSFGGQSSLSRIGGDEFVVLLTGINAPEAAAAVANRLAERLREPLLIEGQELVASISTGVSVFPEDGRDPEELIRRADHAMYRAKRMPGSSVCLAAEEAALPDTNGTTGLGLEASLRQALDQGQFALHYQPYYALPPNSAQSKDAGASLIGAEALIRWHHPNGRLIGPGEFITHAEETGLIVPLGLWVLETAAVQLEKWHSLMPSFSVKVNVSPVQLRNAEFLEGIERVAHRLPDPSRLGIELTERVLLHDIESCEETLNRVAKFGVQIALDDFGTGYASLGYLHRLPFDTVKIDRSFIAPLPSDARAHRICRSIIDMGHGLDLQVIAEGIETEEQLECMRALGCDAVQGYHVGRPDEAKHLEAQLVREAARAMIKNPISDDYSELG